MTREVTDQLYIDLEYFSPEEYYTYIAEANSNAGALFTPSITIGVQVNTFAVLDSVATMDITAEKIVGVEATLSSEFSVEANTGQTLDGSADLASESTLAVDAVANRSAQSTLESIVNLSLQAAKITDSTSSLEAQVTATISVDRYTKYWVNTYYNASDTSPGSSRGIVVDSNKNVYSLNQRVVSATVTDLIIKTDQYGTPISTIEYDFATAGKELHDLAIFSDDDLLAISDNTLIRLDSDFNEVWAKTYTVSPIDYAIIDASDNIYSLGASGANVYLVKYSSSGAVVWSKTLTGINQVRCKPAIDSQGNIIIGARDDSGALGAVVLKYNTTTNSIDWQIENEPAAGYSNYVQGLAVDRNDNVYFINTDQVSSSIAYSYITKYSSSGTFQWNKEIDQSTDSFFIALAFDSLGDVAYVNNQDKIFSFDQNGNVLWQKDIEITGYTDLRPYSPMFIDPAQSGLYIQGSVNRSGSTDTDPVTFKLPLNGTGSGIAPLTYNTSSVTVSTVTAKSGTTSTVIVGTDPGTSETTLQSYSTATPSYTRTFYGIETGGFIANTSADLSSAVDITASVDVLLGIDATVNSEFALAVDIDKLVDFQGSLSSEFTETATAVKTTENTANIGGSAELAVDVVWIRGIDADLASTAGLAADYDLIKDYSADLTAVCALAVEAVVTRDAVITTDSIFTELAAVAKIGDFLVTLETSSALDSQAVKTTDVTVDMSSAFSQTTDGIIEVSGASSMSSSATQTTSAERFRDTTAELASQTSIETTAYITASASASLDSEFTQETTTQGLIGIIADLASEATLDASGDRARDLAADLSANVDVSAQGDRIRLADSAISSLAELDYNIELIKSADIETDSIFTELAVVVKTGSILADFASSATLTTTASIIAENEITLENSVILTADAVKTAEVSAYLTADSNSSIEGTTNVTIEADLSAEFTVSADINLVAQGDILTASLGTMTVAALRIRPGSADLAAQGFELVTGTRIQSAEIQMQSTSQVTVAVGGIFDARSAMTTNGAVLTLAKIIHIDPCLTYVIPAENRTYRIVAENRTYSIIEENRNYTIRGCEQ